MKGFVRRLIEISMGRRVFSQMNQSNNIMSIIRKTYHDP